jgi:hypothetical protein
MVLRQRHEVTLAAPITQVFSALVRMLARSRWSSDQWLVESDELPRIGQPYIQRRGSVVRKGRVVECLRPVLMTLYESLFDAPCRVRLRLRWRLEPLEGGSRVLLDVSYELNGPAYLNRRHWRREIHAHCGKLMKDLEARLRDELSGTYGDDNGQKIGNSSITVTKTTAVKGNPSFK